MYFPKEIFSSDREVKIQWLKAFFDDEATVDIKKKSIRLKIVNLKGLIQIKYLLKEFKIESNITGPNCDNTYFLNVKNHPNILKFHNFIGFSHPKRKKKLIKLIKICS